MRNLSSGGCESCLYKQKSKTYSQQARRRNTYLELIESFISEAQLDETEHGIVENNDISVAEWLEALSRFQERELELLSVFNLSSKIDRKTNLRSLPNLLLGGKISGLCGKTLPASGAEWADIYDRLGCPDCKIPTLNGSFDRPPLVRNGADFKCTQCGFNYPCVEGIIILLPKAELQLLYPTFNEFLGR